ncbi:uncharacterized protein G2W53_012992 [Senna tora]|uniref:Uncharacterized protein n=1 Tax=Senna tora TaxID=362788 RepID=A0A834WSN9_9FABA|nr:uncharacterized protein G2W53_012992 [Senna tora]
MAKYTWHMKVGREVWWQPALSSHRGVSCGFGT